MTLNFWIMLSLIAVAGTSMAQVVPPAPAGQLAAPSAAATNIVYSPLELTSVRGIPVPNAEDDDVNITIQGRPCKLTLVGGYLSSEKTSDCPQLWNTYPLVAIDLPLKKGAIKLSPRSVSEGNPTKGAVATNGSLLMPVTIKERAVVLIPASDATAHIWYGTRLDCDCLVGTKIRASSALKRIPLELIWES
jgi:hypothetical protein